MEGREKILGWRKESLYSQNEDCSGDLLFMSLYEVSGNVWC